MKISILILAMVSAACFINSTPILEKNQRMTIEPKAKNVLGQDLQACCFEPKTGWFRDGYCNTGIHDRGVHVVCAEMTQEFLSFSATCGNDLITPLPQFNFPGLKPGDKWCLCVQRWKDALDAGLAPPVVLESTHEKALETVSLNDLKAHAIR